MENQATALEIFRRLVYALYLEIGALQPANHPEIARKARLNTAFFQRDKERQVFELYRQVKSEPTTAKILAPFEERTGLSLEDIARAFSEGEWRNRFGSFNFGGPRWARIAEATLKLRQQIDQGDEEETAFLLHLIKGLKNNQGYLINQLERVDRRRK
jgi:hypothetical protein